MHNLINYSIKNGETLEYANRENKIFGKMHIFEKL